MMNRVQFISYLDHPDKLSGEDSRLLTGLLKNFPYFQTAHLLLAKSLHNQNSIDYNNQLKITAAYATDRKVLHQFITKTVVPKEEKPVVAETIIAKETIINNLITPAAPIVKEQLSASSPVVELEEKAVEQAPVLKEESSLETQPIEAATIYSHTPADAEELEKDYLMEAANTLIEINILQTELAYQQEEHSPSAEKEPVKVE